MPRPRRAAFQTFCALATVLALTGGCTGSVTVEETFPLPVVAQLPLRVALHYPPALTEFVYSEDGIGERDWTVQLGTANVRMLDAVFTGLFAVTRRVSDIASARSEMPELDAIVVPTLDAFEFSLPSQSATDLYAVWIRYNLEVYDGEGTLVVRWPVSAYGQSGTGGLSDEESMERAIVLALRDAAAAIAVGLEKQPAIREKLLKEAPDDET